MIKIANSPIVGFVLFSALLFVGQPVIAQDYANLITEDYLRAQFVFSDGDKLKYSACEKNSYPTCTYIWGGPSEKDEARIKYGLAPEGNELQIVYAQARSQKDFQRVLATYSDAEEVKGVGVEAVWSGKRQQLSLITDTHLVIHVHISQPGSGDKKEKAIVIAGDLLAQL